MFTARATVGSNDSREMKWHGDKWKLYLRYFTVKSDEIIFILCKTLRQHVKRYTWWISISVSNFPLTETEGKCPANHTGNRGGLDGEDK